MSNEDVERLEVKVAFLERATNELSDVIYRQQQEIAALTERLAALSSRLDTYKAEPVYTAEEERPPHY